MQAQLCSRYVHVIVFSVPYAGATMYSVCTRNCVLGTLYRRNYVIGMYTQDSVRVCKIPMRLRSNKVPRTLYVCSTLFFIFFIKSPSCTSEDESKLININCRNEVLLYQIKKRCKMERDGKWCPIPLD